MNTAKILQFPLRADHLSQEKQQGGASFRNLFSYAADPVSDFPGCGLPKTGVWGEKIAYTKGAHPIHPFTEAINGLRDKRGFTRNAVELRCDCLSLAIYVSGVSQFSVGAEKGGCYVRAVVYVGRDLKPVSTSTANSGEALVELLHEVLATTYNGMALKFNLAGFRKDWLKLDSSNTELVPSISLFKGR